MLSIWHFPGNVGSTGIRIPSSLSSWTGVGLERGDYRGLRLLHQVMSVLEGVAANFLRQQLRIDDKQFGFLPGRSTTNAIFNLRQLHEKFYDINKTLHTAFVDLEKAFDPVHLPSGGLFAS